MESRYTIQHTAFLNTISQLDLSTLPDNLQLEINNLCQALNGEVNENTINLLNNVVQKYLPIKDLYEKELEHSKSFSPSSENSKLENLSANNPNLPTIEKNMSNSKKRQPLPPPVGRPIRSECGFTVPRKGFRPRGDDPKSQNLPPGNSNPPTK